MNFNTAVFLFLFLPAFTLAYMVARQRLRSWLAHGASVVFYAWGQIAYVPLIALLAVGNYMLGRQIGRARTADAPKLRRTLYLGIAANIAVLAFFKIVVTYGIAALGPLADLLPETARLGLNSLVFPLGLSYIAFQAISYLVDVAAGTIEPEHDFVRYALYIFMFPKLLAGPIVRYGTVAEQLARPAPSRDLIAEGFRRFLQGFAKKVLIADVLARLVSAVFDQPAPAVSPAIAWLALIAYALQIYFDFAGYSDMAIGLGMTLGYRFLENFNYPYVSQSVGEFWRRWHISLSSWFRDYVFFPLERRRVGPLGQQINILIVFVLTGLWHGVTLTFLLWGLLHALFLIAESMFLGRLLQRLVRPLRHMYALGAVLLTWLVFRSPSPAFALEYVSRLMGNAEGLAPLPFTQTAPLPFIEPSILLALGVGILISMPVGAGLESMIQRRVERDGFAGAWPMFALRDTLLLGLFVLAVGAMTASKFLPGIYGGF